MTKKNGRWTIGLLATLLVSGTSGGGIMFARMERIDDRQTVARVRNLESIALNAAGLANHGERLSKLEECVRHVQGDLEKLDTKMDRVLAAVE